MSAAHASVYQDWYLISKSMAISHIIVFYFSVLHTRVERFLNKVRVLMSFSGFFDPPQQINNRLVWGQ